MFEEETLARLLDYVVYDTMSDDTKAAKVHPSTDGQWDLLRHLEQQLRGFGLKDVELDSNGYLLARVPANADGIPTIGFSAHVDTADDVDGNHVKPRVIRGYNGGDIVLNDSVSIKVSENPALEGLVGTDIVVAGGDTLLGADDKAGISIIMTVVEHLLNHPEIKHGEIEVLFSPDEETGYGMDFFKPSKLHSKAFYTVDGGSSFELEAECFNAATVRLSIQGVSIHFGSARGKMVNALTVASHLVTALPAQESPESTDGRYGYYVAHKASGNASHMDVEIMVRDFDLDGLKHRIAAIEAIAEYLRQVYNGVEIKVDTEMSYYNMAEPTKQLPKCMDAVYDAAKAMGREMKTLIIRGGTDGSHLAAEGIPCPNLSNGGYNYHGCTEWCSVKEMGESAALVLEIIGQWTK